MADSNCVGHLVTTTQLQFLCFLHLLQDTSPLSVQCHLFEICIHSYRASGVAIQSAAKRSTAGTMSAKTTCLVLVALLALSSIPATLGLCPDSNTEVLIAHNQQRFRQKVFSLRWSSNLETSAQAWAVYIAAKGECKPISAVVPGESVYISDSLSTTCSEAVQHWYRDYDVYYSSEAVAGGLVTQDDLPKIVWEASAEVGCGAAMNSKKHCTVVVCHYLPANHESTSHLSITGTARKLQQEETGKVGRSLLQEDQGESVVTGAVPPPAPPSPVASANHTGNSTVNGTASSPPSGSPPSGSPPGGSPDYQDYYAKDPIYRRLMIALQELADTSA